MIFLSSSSLAQTNSRKYIRLVVSDANTQAATLQIDQHLRSKSGILTSRMDRNTGLYLGIYLEDSGIDSQQIIDWIEELGFSTQCFVEGNHGTGEPIKKIDRASCNSNSILDRN